MPTRQLTYAAISTMFLVACGSAPQPQAPATPQARTSSEYVTITPDESTYPARTPSKQPEPVGEHEDIMASILAIPPGN